MSTWDYPTGAANPPTTGSAGCDECNRPAGSTKQWPIFTVRLYSGTEVCAKCLTPMAYPRRAASAQGDSDA